MNSNHDLQQAVIEELRWNPSLDHTHIRVTCRDGIVTLSGYVTNYFESKKAESIARHVATVKAVVDELDIKLPAASQRNDLDLAESVLTALKLNVLVPKNKITVTVENGWVMLAGQAEWQYQRTAAENAVKYMLGVKGIVNDIALKPADRASNVKSGIHHALVRSAQVDASHIRIEAADGKAILDGYVRSWTEKELAEAVAWSAPGIAMVENRISIAP